MNKVLFAASFLPLAASAAPGDPGMAVQQAFPAYSIDFRQGVLLAQVELKRSPAEIATTAEGIKTTLGGDKDQGKTKAGKAGDGYTDGGYKEQGKTAGAGKDKGPDGYTSGGYKEQAKTAGAGKDKAGDGYTAGGYKDQEKTAGAGKDKSGDGYTAGGYKDQEKTAGAGKDKAGDGYTTGGYKEQDKTAGAGKDKAGDGYTTGGYKDQGKTAGAGKEASAFSDDGYKTSGGFKDHKDAGAGKMLADGYKTSGGFKESGATDGKALGGISDYMKSGRGAPPGMDARTAGEIKLGTTEGAYKFSPAGGIKGEDGVGKTVPDGTTVGGVKYDVAPKGSVMEASPGSRVPVAPLMPVETMKLAPLPAQVAPVTGAPIAAPVAPAVIAPQPTLIKSPVLVPSVLPTK